MKRTIYKIAVRQHSTYTEFRTVYEKDGRFYIKDEGKICDVTDQMERFRYR